MKKLFLFDMDGVLVNSEPVWEKREDIFLSETLGPDVYKKVKPMILGSTILGIYNEAVKNGFSLSKQKFFEKYNNEAVGVYAGSPLAKDVDNLIDLLVLNNYVIGLVTASPLFWVNQVLKKLKRQNAFSLVLSLSEREDLKPKPYPDGYREAIKALGFSPAQTIILEDSNKGIRAAKASKAFTVCLREFLPKGYQSEVADLYVDNIKDLINFLKRERI